MGINECLMALPKEELVKCIKDIVEKKGGELQVGQLD